MGIVEEFAVDTRELVTFILPNGVVVSEKSRLQGGLEFHEDKEPYKREFGIGGIKLGTLGNQSSYRSKSYMPDLNAELIKVQSCIGGDYPTGFHGNCVGYDVKVRKNNMKDRVVVEFVAAKGWLTKRNSPLGIPFETPEFTIGDLKKYLANAYIRLGYEIDSPYQSEAVYTNFKRMLKELSYNEKKDSETGRAFERSYYVPLDPNVDAEVKVAVFPYRTGSKVRMDITMAWSRVRTDAPINIGSS